MIWMGRRLSNQYTSDLVRIKGMRAPLEPPPSRLAERKEAPQEQRMRKEKRAAWRRALTLRKKNSQASLVRI